MRVTQFPLMLRFTRYSAGSRTPRLAFIRAKDIRKIVETRAGIAKVSLDCEPGKDESVEVHVDDNFIAATNLLTAAVTSHIADRGEQ